MPNQYVEIKSMRGLYLMRNSYSVPDGAMEEALNVVLSFDNRITSRRGQYTYFDPVSGTLNNLFLYQNFLLAIYTSKIAYYTDSGAEPNVVGIETINGGTTIVVGTAVTSSRSAQQHGNLYFTTDMGVCKLTAYNANVLTSGAPPGLDVSLTYPVGVSSTWFSAGYIVGYRVVFGYTDANENLILSAPSSTATINNPLYTAVAYTSAGGGPWTVTVDTVSDHGLTQGQYVITSGSTHASADGIHQVASVPTSHSLTYSVVSSDPLSGTLNMGFAMPVGLEASIPSEITTSLQWFYRVYRSSQQLIATGIYSDFSLVIQNNLTSTEINNGVFFFQDSTPNFLLGAELYTNENSAEGELQANTRAPLCTDITVFQGIGIYSNCIGRQNLSLALIDTTQLANNDYVEFHLGASVYRYVAHTGLSNQTALILINNSAGKIQFSYTAHGFSNGYKLYISNIIGSGITTGDYFVVASAANTFEIATTSGGTAINYTAETSAFVQGLTNGTYPIFYLSTNSSASVRIADTAQSLVKAINRDATSVLYAQYSSGTNDVPGQMFFQAKSFVNTITMFANTLTAGTAFSPNLPTTISGASVATTSDTAPNTFFASKQGEMEAVPLINSFPVGSKSAKILRVAALRDSLIVIKEDGVYRYVGYTVSGLSGTILDNTIICVAPNSVKVLNNEVYFLSNQGICKVSDSAVAIVSREGLEDVIQPILGQTNLASQTSAIAYETERLYLLTTSTPNDTTASACYVYNILTAQWSESDKLFQQGVIGPNNKLYGITLDNVIKRERKNQTRYDYSDQNYSITINAISGLTLTVTILAVPEEGDMIVKNNVLTWINSPVTSLGGNQFSFDVNNVNNLMVNDTEILYSRINHVMKWSPFFAGTIGQMKLFQTMEVQLRDNNMSKCKITFAGYEYGGSPSITWNSQLVDEGWGFFPWGFVAWGQAEGIDLTQGTQPSPVVRTYVPTFQARNTFIQPIIEHIRAGEAINIQSLGFVLRMYGTRTSK